MNGPVLDLTRDITERLSRQFDEVAVLAIKRRELMMKIWNSEPSITQMWSKLNLQLRLAKSGRLWILTYETHEPEVLLKYTEEIIKVADKVTESELYAPLPDYALCKPVSGAFDQNIEFYMSYPDKLVESLVVETLSTGAGRVSGTIALSRVERVLITSKGYECNEVKSEFKVYARAFKDEFTGHWAHGSTHISHSAIREVGRRAGMYATITRNRVDFAPGEYNVILSPLVVGNLFEYVAHMASALSVLTGFSMFAKHKPGDSVAAECFSLYDAPRDTSLPGTLGFDDEGVETRNKPIIENGMFTSFLHNAATASKMSTKSTGNAGWIRPRPWSLDITGGDVREDELIRELRNGVFVVNNWYTRLQNYYEGVFSTVSRDTALLIKNGEVAGHVGRIRIASTFNKLMRNIQGLSRERFDVWWWEVRVPTRAPFMVVSNTQLTKPEV